METEWDFSDKVNFDPVFIVDELRVKVAVDGDLLGALPVWDSHYTTNTTLGSWVHTFVNLEAYRGQSVQLIFEFASGDGNYNDFAGPFVDDVDFGTTCKADAQIQCMDGGDCAAPGDCAAVACTQDFACQYTPLNTIQCCEPADIQSMAITFEDTDELQAAGWEVSACEPSETSPTSQVDLNTTWKSASVVTGAGIEPKSGDGMLYFGNGLDYGGATQTAACATAVSPAVTLEDNDVPWTLSYWLYMDIEPASDCPPIGGIPFVDVFTLELLDVDSGESTLMLLKDNLLCNEYDDWTFRDFDLSPWLGKTIRFRFKFNSWDEQENFGKGIAFDEFRFERGCPEF